MITGILYILRYIFWAIDNALAGAVKVLYTFLFELAGVNIFQNYIIEFADRIYSFLAIFMVFKLSISMVNYILNPDQFTDKTKGFSKIIQKVIIVIILIITVPTIFDWAYKLQCLVLNSGVLNSIISGVPNDNDGEKLELTCFSGEYCSPEARESRKYTSNMLTYTIFSSFVYQTNNDSAILIADIDDDHGSALKGAGVAGTGNTCEEVGQIKDANGNVIGFDYVLANNCIFNIATVGHVGNTYLILLSTACLGFVAYVFLGFTIDISIRSVKLSFLQLMAPVPIISMLDPNSGKSGMFSKWLKECTKTYADVFIRLGAVFFGTELIKQFMESGVSNSCNVFVTLFIILGILAFVKKIPQLIESLTGIKLSGDGLSLKKKFGQIPGSKMVGNSLSTLGKKTIAGLDAKKNGQNFKDGWKKIEGTDPISKFKKNYYAARPYSAQTVKNKTEGAAEIKAIDTKWNKGKELADKVNGDIGALDGKTKDNYKKIFQNEQFVESKFALDNADEDLKRIRQRNVAAQASGELTENMVKELENQEKKVAGLQKVHDSMRKMYGEDAAAEDAFKFYKNNATNPANLKQTRVDASSGDRQVSLFDDDYDQNNHINASSDSQHGSSNNDDGQTSLF